MGFDAILFSLYGRGSRATASLTARADTERPISASSAAAWTIVPTIALPCGGVGAEGGWVGLPADLEGRRD
jgi:hypothetical protein